MNGRFTGISMMLFAAVFLTGGPACGQQYPVKPIRFIVGPGPDVLARLIGQKMTESWGQQVIVDQRPGAGGTIAADSTAKAAPDGYTLLLTTGSFTINVNLYRNLPYDFVRDLAPVSLLGTLPFIFVVHPSLPVTSVKALIALARSRPGQLNYASAGNGTPPHLAAEMLKNTMKINIVHVPYKGVAPAIIDMLSGQVQMMFAVAPAGLPHVTSGRLRALAVSSPRRALALPEVPTMAEAGVPGFNVVSWNGVHVPAKTPPAVIEKLNAEILRALKQKDVLDRMLGLGYEPVGTSPQEFDALVRADIARWAKVIRESDIHAD